MKPYKELTKDELLTVKAALEEEYKTLESQGLKLNMARGKPGFTQLDLCEPMLDIINSASESGLYVRIFIQIRSHTCLDFMIV